MTDNTALQRVYKHITRPLCIFDLTIASTLICAIISYLVSDRTILITDGGFRVVLIRFSSFLELILVTNGLWLFIGALNNIWFKSKRVEQVNIPLFILSNILGLGILVSNALHFIMFGAHWSISSILTLIEGSKHESAPLNLSASEIITDLLIIILFYYCLLFIIKIINPIGRKIASHHCGVPLLLLIFGLTALVGIQHSFPSNWHAQQLQKGIPWIEFIPKPINFVVTNDKINALQDIKSQQQQRLSVMQDNTSHISDSITAKHRPNILMVHIEALRGDMFTNENMPYLYEFAQNQGESLPKHYSSSNNTVGSIFGIVTGITGPLYQFFREQPFDPASFVILKKLGYQLNKYNSVSSSYQNADTLIFSDFKSHDFFKPDIITRERQMIDAYIKDTSTLDSSQPRFDYLVLNSTHFPYRHTEAEEVFKPTINLKGLSMRSDSFKYLNKNKIKVKNRFRNAVLFIDNQLNRLITGLQTNGYLSEDSDNIIVIVGDHGQEFWEHNRFSHSWSFVDEQTHVTAVVRFPEKLSTKYRYSSHSDFFPTIFSSMGVDFDISSVMNGKNLAQYTPEEDFINIAMSALGKQKQNSEAVVGNGLKVEYSVAPEFRIDTVITDTDDKANFKEHEQTVYQLLLNSINNSI